MIDTLHIDDLDGAVTLFKSTDEGTETIAVFDEEHREVIQDLLAEVKRLREALLRIADTANGRPFISGHMDSFVGEVLKELIE